MRVSWRDAACAPGAELLEQSRGKGGSRHGWAEGTHLQRPMSDRTRASRGPLQSLQPAASGPAGAETAACVSSSSAQSVSPCSASVA